MFVVWWLLSISVKFVVSSESVEEQEDADDKDNDIFRKGRHNGGDSPQDEDKSDKEFDTHK